MWWLRWVFTLFFKGKSCIVNLNIKQWISGIILMTWNKTLPLISSCHVHSSTDPILTPTARPNIQQARTPPASALYWNCSKAVKTPSFSHSPHPQRACLKHTPARARMNAHTHATHTKWKTVYMQPCTLTQVGQSCSGSSKQSSSTMELITVSKIKFYLQHGHTWTNITYHMYVWRSTVWDHLLVCLAGQRLFVLQRDRE